MVREVENERQSDKGSRREGETNKVVKVMTGSDVADCANSPRLCLRKSWVKNTIYLRLNDTELCEE